ncbi:MAG: dephospho-CoA kinase, partial [Anaeroplasmataceae bacterium]|nr:dephospho-CoA kinase [Anaeroplasmataceae bacterium]
MRKVVGITGGIASGKSLVCEYLISLGYHIIDSDAISRRLSQKGNPIYQAILESFGSEYFLPNLELDRKKLGRYIFENSDARDKLNAITHPLIVEEIKNLIRKSKENLIFLDIPLLFEAKLSYLCDTIV